MQRSLSSIARALRNLDIILQIATNPICFLFFLSKHCFIVCKFRSQYWSKDFICLQSL